MPVTNDDSTTRVRALLDEAGITVEGEDFDAVARLYQRFAGQRALLASQEAGDTEPMTVAVFHPEGSHSHERR